MRKVRQIAALMLMVVTAMAPLLHSYAGFVKGYYRKDGTYVAPHYRADSSSRSKGSTSSCYTPSYAPTISPVKTSYFTAPKSYQVYQQRQSQGPRVFSKGMKQQKYNEQGGICSHCGKHGTMSEMEADHVVPYSKGGKTEYSNLQILCRPCNRSKGNRFSR